MANLALNGGDVPRRNAPVAATLPTNIDPGNGATWKLIVPGAFGPAIPAQIERTGTSTILRWIEPELLPGQVKTYQLVASENPPAGGFRFVDGDGWRDLAFDAKGFWRHMNKYDPADHASTFKPFHHVYGLHDEGFITNGPGSEEWGAKGEGIRFPHHRGLFFGYSKTPYGDFWHGSNGVSQRHVKYDPSREFAGPVVAREAGICEWVAKDGKPVIRDTREVTAWRISDDGIVLDFDVTLESLTGEAIPLGGDPQHAGFHFRAANEVGQAPATQPGATPTTRRGTGGGNAIYTRPAGAVAKGNDVWAECPWVNCAFTIKGNPYSVSEMSSPTNPQPTVYSTRPYGRFGAFFDGQQVAPDKPLKLKYRFIIRDGSTTPDAKQLDAEYQDFVTPVNVTVAK
ncbi:MAG: DUF6807 family protein [Tepidisphaeraceae bacterium]